MFLAVLTDSFNFSFLKENISDQKNLLMDLRINYFITILLKLQTRNGNQEIIDEAERGLQDCAFYREKIYTEVLQMPDMLESEKAEEVQQ